MLALYQQYLEQGETFVPIYHELLASGGSVAPAELVSRIGLDLNDPGFWQGGYDFMAGLLDELEGLVAEREKS